MRLSTEVDPQSGTILDKDAGVFVGTIRVHRRREHLRAGRRCEIHLHCPVIRRDDKIDDGETDDAITGEKSFEPDARFREYAEAGLG